MQMALIIGEEGQQRGILRVQWCFRVAIAMCALICSWFSRYQLNPDCVSYLDMGDLYWKGNWHAALNTYWSPLYGWLTGLTFLVTKPTMRWEYPAVHLLNFVILLATLFCFEYFWRELMASKENSIWVGAWQPHAWVLGYLLFAYIHLGVHRLLLVTPDLLVDAVVYLTAGMMLRFVSGRMGAACAVLLGLLLGVGYLAKAAILPFAIVFMITMLAVAWRQHRSKTLVAIVFMGFLITSLPFIAALSWNARRFTWGDSAKMNQGWYVNGARQQYWQGDGPRREHALHPARKLLDWPEVYEFATPVAGTYPVWYNPSYWNAGLDSSVHPALEMKAFMRNFLLIMKTAGFTSGFLVTVTLLFIMGGRVRDSCRNMMTFWPILVPGIAIFLLYMMVYWETRYTSAILLTAWSAAIIATRIAGEGRHAKVFWTACLLLGALFVCRFSITLFESYRDGGNDAQTVQVAERLRALGIEPGTPVAVIGDGYLASYWARLARLRIVAEVPSYLKTGDSAAAFWNTSPEKEMAVLNALKSAGTKVVVAETHPALLPPGWLPLGNTGHAVYFFQ